ncbi:MAG TPA: hypothetical protein VFQ77_10310 [Pseudonocardiaceae bacterium]|nr:hypothetical protein [Pseudonocardiaceae bacterium]
MADLISGKAFGHLFRTFGHSARRLETRDRYRDPEEYEAFARYLAGSPEDPSYVASRDYWLDGTVRTAIDAGRCFARVRVVPEPLTPYLRFGLYHCAFNVEAGEDIRYLTRDRANALDLPGHDFWLFDEERLALLWFTSDDRLLGAQVITEPPVVRQHTRWLDLAEAHATPYRDYLAADPSRAMPPGGV